MDFNTVNRDEGQEDQVHGRKLATKSQVQLVLRRVHMTVIIGRDPFGQELGVGKR